MQSTEPEIWKPVVGYEGFYEVSDHGAVRSLDRTDSSGRKRRGRLMHPRTSAQGYMSVGLKRPGDVPQHFQVHRLVLEAFVGPAPTGTFACHWDDVKNNNCLTNLRWDTASANYDDAVRNGRRSGHTPGGERVCKRGHELRAPNLIEKKDGTHRCRSCNRARGYSDWKGTAFDPDRADAAYIKIMGTE